MQEMPASPWAPQVMLAHTAFVQPSHFTSVPVHLMLTSRGVPLPAPNALLGSAMPATPRFSCEQRGRQRGRQRGLSAA